MLTLGLLFVCALVFFLFGSVIGAMHEHDENQARLQERLDKVDSSHPYGFDNRPMCKQCLFRLMYPLS